MILTMNTTSTQTQIRNPVMVLITTEQYRRLLTSGYTGETPIVKLFCENLTWLVTGIDKNGILYGYADLGMQCVEFGSLCHVSELPTMRGRICYLERDRFFTHKPDAKYLEMDSLVGI
jgi:hypothetical protein